jgi:hypothetical protein
MSRWLANLIDEIEVPIVLRDKSQARRSALAVLDALVLTGK